MDTEKHGLYGDDGMVRYAEQRQIKDSAKMQNNAAGHGHAQIKGMTRR